MTEAVLVATGAAMASREDRWGDGALHVKPALVRARAWLSDRAAERPPIALTVSSGDRRARRASLSAARAD